MKQTQKIAAGVVIAVAVVAVAFYFIYSPAPKSEIGQIYTESIENSDLSLSFSYEAGDNGLSLLQPEVTGEPLKAAYIIMPTQDYLSFRNDETEESPATISIFVFSKPDQPEGSELSRLEEIEEWAQSNQQLTSINLVETPPEQTEIDGVKALRYMTGGLYQQEVYLSSYKKNIYMFVGQFDSPEDKIRADFMEVMSTVSFQ